MPDPEKMKQFMESFGKKDFGEAKMEMIKQFCGGEEKPNPQEMKALMEKCGCSLPQTAKTESAEGQAEAGKKRLAGDTVPEATSDEVKDLRAEARQLKETLADLLIENRLLKKSVIGDGESGTRDTPHAGLSSKDKTAKSKT